MIKAEHAAKGQTAYFTCECGEEITVVMGYNSQDYMCICGEYHCDDCWTYCVKCENDGCTRCFPTSDWDLCEECGK
jgi:hypothetical protein